MILGTIGIVLPILPTTPFVLLSAACYIKSSTKFYNWLINNKLFGTIIENYINKKGIPIKTKISAITLLWLSIIFSIVFIINIIWVKIMLIIIAICVTIHLLTIKNYIKPVEEIKYNSKNESII